jgi:hypothetical protein
MRKTTCTQRNCTIYRQLGKIRMSALDRQSAAQAMREGEAIADAVIWLKERIASLGAKLPRLGFRH